MHRTNLYADVGLHQEAGVTTVPEGTQAALNAGIFNPGAISIPFEWSTGNCTFSEPYASIGFCSYCSDLSGDLDVVNSTMLVTGSGSNSSIPYSKTSLPSGLSAVWIDNCDGSCYGGPNDDTGTVQTIFTMGTSLANSWLGGNPASNDLANSSSWAGSAAGRGAAQCTLSPCVREYTASISGGKRTEDVVSISSAALAWGFNGGPSGIVKVDCLSEGDRKLLSAQGYDVSTDTKGWLTYDNTFEVYGDGQSQAEPIAPLVDQSCIYEYFNQGVAGLYQSFNTLFNVSIYTDGDAFGGPTVAQAFFDFGNVNFESYKTTFENIAQSLTVHIRTNGNATYSAPAIGQVFNQETYVRVRWPWLAYLAVVVLLLLVFFAAMVWETARDVHRARGWKSSPLALMYHGLDPEVRQRHSGGDLVDSEDMERDSRGLAVRLAQTEKGWVFTDAER